MSDVRKNVFVFGFVACLEVSHQLHETAMVFSQPQEIQRISVLWKKIIMPRSLDIAAAAQVKLNIVVAQVCLPSSIGAGVGIDHERSSSVGHCSAMQRSRSRTFAAFDRMAAAASCRSRLTSRLLQRVEDSVAGLNEALHAISCNITDQLQDVTRRVGLAAIDIVEAESEAAAAEAAAAAVTNS